MTTALVLELSAFVLYFSLLSCVAWITYTKQRSDTDFVLGHRSMNFWLTALAAHASDMSSWLFMGYPALIYTQGIYGAWSAIGLLFFMYLNWELVAPKVRIATEKVGALTFSTFFEKRFSDSKGLIRICSAFMLVIFYTVYIASALTALGHLIHLLFSLPIATSILIAVLLVTPYVLLGGYLTLAWIDLFQGLFLLLVVIGVPMYLLPKVGWIHGIAEAFTARSLSPSLLPKLSFDSLLDAFFLMAGWGLGYFGQPHIITKFMGIKKVSEIQKSKRLGMSWMWLSLAGATCVGLIAIALFPVGSVVDMEVFIAMVKNHFSPFTQGIVLCAVFAATINAISSMILVLTSTVSEDIYKKLLRPSASSKELLAVSRLSVITVSITAAAIALLQISSIYTLVLYAWSGLGASFGPLLLGALYSKRMNKKGAWAAIVVGGGVSAISPLFLHYIPLEIPPLLPAFILSSLAIWLSNPRMGS